MKEERSSLRPKRSRAYRRCRRSCTHGARRSRRVALPAGAALRASSAAPASSEAGEALADCHRLPASSGSGAARSTRRAGRGSCCRSIRSSYRLSSAALAPRSVMDEAARSLLTGFMLTGDAELRQAAIDLYRSDPVRGTARSRRGATATCSIPTARWCASISVRIGEARRDPAPEWQRRSSRTSCMAMALAALRLSGSLSRVVTLADRSAACVVVSSRCSMRHTDGCRRIGRGRRSGHSIARTPPMRDFVEAQIVDFHSLRGGSRST